MRKHIILFTAMTLAALATMSCSESKLQRLVDEANADCPQSLGVMGDITSVELKDGQVVISYAVSEEYAEFDALNAADPALVKSSTLLLFKHQNDAILSIINDLAEEKAGLTLHFTGNETGKEFILTLTPEEIAAVATSDEEEKNYEAALQAHADLTNTQCPMEVENGVTLEQATVEDNYYVYNFTVDENVFTIEQLNTNKEQAKLEIAKTLDVRDPVVRLVIMLCGKAEKGIAFRYCAEDNDNECFVAIEADEVRPLLHEVNDYITAQEEDDTDELNSPDEEEDEEED